MSVRVAKTKKFLFALMLSLAFTTNVASADLAEDIKNDAVGESVLTENYTFSAPAGALAGSGRIYTIKSAVQAAIAGGGHAGISVAYGQTLTIQDVSSISGFADTVNGGFLTNAGTVNINAINNNVTFTSNTVNGVYNDVYDNSGTINLNAGTYVEGTETKPRIITFNGAVNYVVPESPEVPHPVDGSLVLNGNDTAKGGEYHFNSDLGGKLNLRNGAVIRLGAYNHETGKAYGEEGYTVATDLNKQTYGALRLVEFNPGSNTDHNMVTLDLRNGYVDRHDFGKVTQNASVNHLLDVDINAGKADWFTAESTTAINGDILLGGFNLLSGEGSEQKIINLSRNTFRFAMALKPGFDIEQDITKYGSTYTVKSIDYDFLSGNLVLNADEFQPNGGTIDLVYKTSRDYLRLGKGNHATYSDEGATAAEKDIVKVKDDDHPYVVVINGDVYYFRPKETSDAKNDAIIDLAATGSVAIREVLEDNDYIFKQWDEKKGMYHYYTYSINSLPKSIWDHTEATKDSYNYYKVVFDTNTNGYTTKYYNINLREDFMHDIDTTTWTPSSESEPGTIDPDYTWWPAGATIPGASNFKPYMSGGDLTKAIGFVRFNLPKNGDTTETKYFKYTYTVPDDYTRQTTRKELNNDYITNEYFYGLTSGDNGGAVYNNKGNGLNINADFIGNKSTKSSTDGFSGGGAIYNGSSGTLGFISGTFIDNYATQSGAAINNYKGDIKAIIGDFIGNNSDRAGGAIRNISGTIGLIHGQFIGNRAIPGSTTSGWGGAIASKNTDSEIKIIQGNFIANNVGMGGGAIDINGKLGTVIGDFIANKAGKDGGGAIRVEDGEIGSITGDFIGNTAEKGGAIHSQTKNSKSRYGTIYGDFIGNKATKGDGGAINNDSGSSTFDAIYGDLINNSASGNGGAINTKGKINRVSANFIGNVANGKGGAIYLNGTNSVVAICADAYGDSLFTGNKAGDVYNDVYNDKGTLKLNAEAESETKQHTITFDGTIEGDGTGRIDINSDSTKNGGKYIFNNTVSGNKVYLYNDADVKLGSVTQADNSDNIGHFNVNILQNDENHGSIDLQNGYREPQAQSLGAVTLKSDLYLKIDADLQNTLADTFSATSFTSSGGTHKFMINSINVLADSPSDSPVEVNVADDVLRTHFGLSSSAINVEGLTKNYLVSYSAASGNLKFSNTDLYSAVHSEESERNYNMLADEDLWCNLGTMKGTGSTLTINGGGFDINGYDDVDHYSGITVQSGQTLNVKNVGAWKDMSGGEGSVLKNSGTLNITNTNFEDNVSTQSQLTGGLILNTGSSANMTITDSSFTDNTGRIIRNISGATITNMSGVTIKGGGLPTSNQTYDRGGAIYNEGTIDNIENVVIRETTAYVGSAIFNKGHIGTVKNMTISGAISADNIFGNENPATIDLIDNLTIENSSGSGLSFYGNASVGTIQNSTFTGMYGSGTKVMGFGLQFTTGDSKAAHADLLDNVVVSSNQRGGIRIDDNGNNAKSYITLIKNSQFTDNGGTGSDKAGGIWAKTNTLTISADGEGKKTVFKGNKRQGASVGIWMDNKNSTLNLQQLHNGEMYMYDRINGTNDKYYVNISGDNTGTLYLYDNIVNGMVDVQDTKLSTVDGVIHSYTFSTLKSDEDSKYFLDINFKTDDLPSSTIDNFTITNSSLTPETGVTKETSGKITIKALNFINDVQDMRKNMEATLQVLHSPTDNLQLEKGFDKEGGFDVLFVLQDDTKQEVEQIAPVTPWHEDIAIYSVKTKILGQVELLKTDTINDTLHIIIESALQDKEQIGSMDTLAAVNQANLANRTYSTNVENDVFNVSMNLGATEGGNFTVLGADSVNRSVIDFGETEHYKGFELDSPTNLTLQNVEIKNSSQLVSGIATNATIRAYDSYLHDNGEGIYTAGNMNVEGTTRIDDNIHLMGDNSALTITGAISEVPVTANVTFNGEVGGSGTSTFTFGAGTVNLGNQASVSDTNLTLSNTTLNVGANDAFSGVKLTGGNSTLNLKNESVGVQNFDSLTLNNDINIGLDVDLTNSSTDKITVAAGDVVTPNAHNIIINSIYLMTDASSATTNIILTEDNRFKNVYKLSNDILANVTRAASVSGSYTINYADFATEVDPSKGILIFNRDNTDTLATTIVKDMGEAAIKAYLLPEAGETVEANLGTLNGAKLVINGNGQTDTNFIKGGNAHTGVVLGDGKTQTLEVNNVKEWSGFTDSAIKNKSDGTVKILNTNFSGNTVSDIDNSGVLEFSGTNTLVKVNDSAATANGTIEIKDGTTTIANVQQKSVTITNGKLVVSNSLTTTSGVTNNKVYGLEITGGTINSSVSGALGSTKINSEGTVSLTDGKTISQQINLVAGTFNTSASGIKGGLNITGGTIELTGGTLTSEIMGTTGTTIVKGDVTIGTNGSVVNDVSIEGKLTSLANQITGDISNAGNLYLTGGANANAITGVGTTTFSNTSSNSAAIENDVVNTGTLTNTGSITGNVTNSGTIQNNGTLTGAVTNNGGASLTSLANKITGNISNAGNLYLTGGANANTITGGGTTTFSNTSSNSASIANAVVNSGTLTNTGAITGDVTNNGTLTSSVNNLQGAIANTGTFNATGTLAKTISGNGTTKVNGSLALNDGANVVGSLDINGGTLTVSENAITTHNVGSLKDSGSPSGNFEIDLKYVGTDVSSDTINLGSDTTEYTLKITSLNEIGTRPDEFETQILTGTNGNTKLDISSIASQFNSFVTEQEEVPLASSTIAYNADYGTRKWDKTTTLSVIGSDTGLLDTLKYTTVRDNYRWDPKAENLTLINTYTGTGSSDRKIDFTGIFVTSATGTYTMQESTSLGTTSAGKLTLDGVTSGTNITTVNLNGNNGFNLTNATELVLNNIDLKGASGNLISATNDGASVKLNNSVTEGNIVKTGTNKMTVVTTGNTTLGGNTTNVALTNNGTLINNGTITGTVNNTASFENNGNGAISGTVTNSGTLTSLANKITGDISNAGNLYLTGGANANAITGVGTTTFSNTSSNSASIANAVVNSGTLTNTGAITGDVTNNGTLTSSVNNLQGAIANTGTFNATGTLAKTISENGTTVVDSTLTLNNNGHVVGTLNANGGTITISTDSITSHNIGTLTGNGNLVIDINSGAQTVDNISYTTGGTGTLTITSLNDIGTKPTAEGTYNYTVLTGSGITLALDNAIKTSSEWYQEETITPGTKTPDAIQANTEWNHKYYERWKDTHTAKSLDVSGNKLVFNVMNHQTDGQEVLGDTLKLVNNDTTNTVKNFTANEDGAVYTVSENLGVTKGTVNINGIAGDSAETINLNSKSGFELGEDATALNFNNVTVGGNTTIATVTNENAIVNVNNSIINGAITGAVSYAVNTSGTTTLSNVTAGALTNTGTLTLSGDTTASVTNSGTIQNNGMLTGAVTNNGGALLTSLANKINGDITNSGTVNLTGGGLTTAISGGNITISGDVTSNAGNLAGAISNASSTLTLTGGDISGNISGNGTTKISGTVTNTTGKTLGNAVTLDSGSKLTTVAGAIANTITGVTSPATTPIVELNGGTLGDHTISKAKIVIADNVTANADNLAGTEINNATAGKTLTLTGGDIKAEITGNGTTAITGTVTNTGNNDLNNAINVATTGTLTTGAGTLKNTVTNSGTVDLTGGDLTTTISGGNITISGNVSSDITKLDGTITNNSTFNMTGDLSKDIGGTGTTVLQSTTSAVGANRTVTGTLDLNGKTIGMKDSSYEETLTVGKLINDGNLTLDVDARTTTGNHDTINITGTEANSSVITITDLNMLIPASISGDTYTYQKQILTGNTNGATLSLSTGVTNVYNKEININRTGETDLDTNEINWDANYGGWTQDGTEIRQVTITDSSTTSLQDSIKYIINKVWDTPQYTTKSENLAIMNTYTGTGSDNRIINFTGIHEDADAHGTYTVKANIGTSSAGKMTLNGERVGDSNTTVNLDGKAGFALSNATELTIKNINMQGNDTLITVSNASAKVNLENTNMNGAITGSAEYDMNTTGANTLKNVTGAKVANSGTLSLSGTNNLVNITNAAGSTTITGGTTTSGAITQNTVTISGGKLVATNGITTTNGVTNNVANGLEIQGGIINSAISGTGSVDIAAGTGTVSLTDGKTISQQIDLKSGTFNTNASGIGTGITLNGGNVELTGGTLAKAISGTTGTTTIKTGNVSITDGSIGNNVVIDSGSLTSDISKLGGTITNNSTFNMAGDLSKDIGGTGTTVLQSDTSAVAANRTVTGTLDLNGKTIGMKDSSYETLTVGKLINDGNLTLDVDATANKADQIVINNTDPNNSELTITTLNLTAPTDVAEDSYTYSKMILTGNTSGASIVLDPDAAAPYIVVDKDIERTGTDTLATNTINWNDNYGGWKEAGLQNNNVEIVGTDTIKYSIAKTWSGTKEYTSKTENLAIMNTYDDTNRTVDFSGILNDPTAQGNYTVTSDLGITKAGKLTINGETDGENTAVIDFNGHSGFGLDNPNTELVIENLEIKGASALVTETAATTDVKVVLNNVNIHDNNTGIMTSGNVEIKGNSTIADKVLVQGASSKIDIDGTNTVTLNSSLTGTGTSNKLNISGGTVNLGNNASITGLDTTFDNTALNLANENTLNGLNATFSGTNNLNMANNSTNSLALGNINLNGVLNMQVDADLANKTMDKISATTAAIGAGSRIDVSKINLMSPTTEKQLDLIFTDNSTLAGIVNYTGEGQIVYSPIYKYNTSYIQKDGKGYFSFASAGSSPSDFNPAVMASSVATIVTGYQNQMQALHQGFYHMDRYMKHSDSYRFAAENQNKIASLTPVTNLDVNRIPETSQAMWVIPYTTFERVNLSGGVSVDNISYGMTYGGDSDMFDMGHGFKGVISGFIGYNGNHMTYNGVSMTQNGGFLGATLNAYRGNFFTGLTVSTGASAGDADTMYGHDNITLLTAGIANKTGYNFEFLKGKIILQPALFLGYSWVNTFDYTNSAGVKIKQDALNALQIAPGIKLIGNTKNGWQPYAGIDMVWNIFMGRNQATANEVVLPKLSERAYVQYGVGVQKTWADRFTGFLQAMIRNGGRNGVVLSAGFRWTLGKNNKKTKHNTSAPDRKTVIKSLK